MNISKFVYIDAAILITTITLLFLFQKNKKNSNLLKKDKKDKFFRKTSFKLPKKEKLVELENKAKNQGSGIELTSLTGDWKFVSVWKNNIDEEDPVFSSLLRLFRANLNFNTENSDNKLPEFAVKVSIQFGPFTIEFSGSGCLKGKQPILPFIFNLIQLKSGSNTILSRSLHEQVENEKPFFALISLEENSELLLARGQGGAVIIWMKD